MPTHRSCCILAGHFVSAVQKAIFSRQATCDIRNLLGFQLFFEGGHLPASLGYDTEDSLCIMLAAFLLEIRSYTAEADRRGR